MGFSDVFSDFYASIGFPELHAEAPSEDEEKDEGGKGGDDKGEEGGDKEEGEGQGGEEGGEEDGGDDEGGDDEEEEEEEEEEPEDPKPKLEADCAKSVQCAPAKHHYEDCAERVTKRLENHEQHKGPKEDCVEEFFHLQHCATQCAAPKLFRMLK